MLNVGLQDPPFAPHEGQKASKSSRSRNEGIPEGVAAYRSFSVLKFAGLDARRN